MQIFIVDYAIGYVVIVIWIYEIRCICIIFSDESSDEFSDESMLIC